MIKKLTGTEAAAFLDQFDRTEAYNGTFGGLRVEWTDVSGDTVAGGWFEDRFAHVYLDPNHPLCAQLTLDIYGDEATDLRACGNPISATESQHAPMAA